MFNPEMGPLSEANSIGRRRLFILDNAIAGLASLAQPTKVAESETILAEAAGQRPIKEVVRIDLQRQENQVNSQRQMEIDSRVVIDEIHGEAHA